MVFIKSLIVRVLSNVLTYKNQLKTKAKDTNKRYLNTSMQNKK